MRALLTLAIITVASLALLGATMLAGDQRRVTVVNIIPAEGEALSSMVRALSITFDRDVDRESVLDRLEISPPVEGTARWRGRTLEYVPAGRLQPGDYQLTLRAGGIGRASEQLADDLSVAFTVRPPSILMAQDAPDGQHLVLQRPGEEPRTLASASGILSFAAAPDGAQIALITMRPDGTSQLVLIDVADGTQTVLVDDPAIGVSAANWAPDGSALLVSRTDQQPDGSMGLPRVWLMRISGEFVGTVGDQDLPSSLATWSPDAQSIAYVSPATSEVLSLNLSTQESTALGTPRSTVVQWAPDSSSVAFESTPPTDTTSGPLLQPVMVTSTDGTTRQLLGQPGEIRTQPRYLSPSVIMMLDKVAGPDSIGTELVSVHLPDGEERARILLAPASEPVLWWDLDPGGTQVVYATQNGPTVTVRLLHLNTGEQQVLPGAGRVVAWLP